MAKKVHDEDEIELHEGPDSDLTQIDAEDTLRAAGIYYVWGSIKPGGLKDIHQDVLLKHYLGPRRYNQPVQLIISSPGGDVDETNSLLDLLANVRFSVATAGFGTCASAAAMLLAAGTKGLRTIAPNTGVMIHCYSWGNAGNHHDLLAHRKAEDAEYEKEIAFWTKHSRYKRRSDVEKHLLRKHDVWLTAKEAVEHGIVDRIGGVLR